MHFLMSVLHFAMLRFALSYQIITGSGKDDKALNEENVTVAYQVTRIYVCAYLNITVPYCV